MVSYIRARAETMGFKANVGLTRRQERVVILGLGLLLNMFDGFFNELFDPILFKIVGRHFAHPPFAIATAVFVLAFSTNITALQRLYYVYEQFREENKKME